MIDATSRALRPLMLVVMLMAGLSSVAGCRKVTGEAVIIGKEHIAAHAPDTMPAERQTEREQWIANVEMLHGRRKGVTVVAQAWRL